MNDKPKQFQYLFTPPKDWKMPSGEIIKHKPYKKFFRTDIKKIFEENLIL